MEEGEGSIVIDHVPPRGTAGAEGYDIIALGNGSSAGAPPFLYEHPAAHVRHVWGCRPSEACRTSSLEAFKF